MKIIIEGSKSVPKVINLNCNHLKVGAYTNLYWDAAKKGKNYSEHKMFYGRLKEL